VCVFATFSWSIHSSLVGYLGCLHSLAIMNSTAINECTRVSIVSWLHSFEQMPRTGITGLHGSSIFGFLRNLHIHFHNDCTNSHSHRQWEMLIPHQHLLLFVFLKMAILTGVRWNFSVVLICISFMARNGKYFFMDILAICTASFENCLFEYYKIVVSWHEPQFW
jgi:hypothetical protein